MPLPRFLDRALLCAASLRRRELARLMGLRCAPSRQARFWILASDLSRAHSCGESLPAETRELLRGARRGEIALDFPSRALRLALPLSDTPRARDWRAFLALEGDALLQTPDLASFLASRLPPSLLDPLLLACREGDARLERLRPAPSDPPSPSEPSPRATWPSPI